MQEPKLNSILKINFLYKYRAKDRTILLFALSFGEYAS